MKLNSKSQAGTKADSSKKDDATIVRQHSSKPHVISRLSDFEWTCLWMAVRYAMNRQTIASATLPQDIIKNYYSRLNDGQKKSIILTKKLFKQPDRIAIYGWSGLHNKNIQPVSLVHKAEYVDYSHGLRLVSNKALFNGKWVNLQSIMKSNYAEMISDEGPLTGLSKYLNRK